MGTLFVLMIFNEAAYLQFKSIFRNSICLSLIVK